MPDVGIQRATDEKVDGSLFGNPQRQDSHSLTYIFFFKCEFRLL